MPGAEKKALERCREVSEGAAGGGGAEGGPKDQAQEIFTQTCWLLQLPGLVLDQKSSFVLRERDVQEEPLQ